MIAIPLCPNRQIRHESTQEGRPTQQGLPDMQQAFHLAKKMGPCLGLGALLLGGLQQGSKGHPCRF